nr:MAG TPA: hypothetical protein [Caudoviricetes sp.]
MVKLKKYFLFLYILLRIAWLDMANCGRINNII